jgi:hypothetical protein
MAWRAASIANWTRRLLKKPVGSYEESIRLTRKVGEGRLDLAAGARLENCNLQAERAGSFRQIPRRSFGSRSIGRIDQHGNASGLGHNLVQKPEPFGGEVGHEKIDSGRVAARPVEAGDETKLDRVHSNAKDDRDRRGRGLGRERRRVAAGRGNERHAAAHEVGHQLRQPIVSAAEPVILHGDILTIDIAGFPEACAERHGIGRSVLGRPAVDECDDRHRGPARVQKKLHAPAQ